MGSGASSSLTTLDSITNAVTVANSLLSIKGIIYNNLVVKG